MGFVIGVIVGIVITKYFKQIKGDNGNEIV